MTQLLTPGPRLSARIWSNAQCNVARAQGVNMLHYAIEVRACAHNTCPENTLLDCDLVNPDTLASIADEHGFTWHEQSGCEKPRDLNRNLSNYGFPFNARVIVTKEFP